MCVCEIGAVNGCAETYYYKGRPQFHFVAQYAPEVAKAFPSCQS